MSALNPPILYAGAVRIDVDLTSLIVLVLFTGLFFMLKKLIFEPFLEDVDQRDDRTTKMHESATALEARADVLRAEYKVATEAATDEAFEARRTLRVEGLHQKDSQVNHAQAKAQDEYKEQSAKLQAQFESARKEALSQAGSLAESIAAKVLGRALVWFGGALALGALSPRAAFANAAGQASPGTIELYLFNLANQAASLLVIIAAIVFFGGRKIQASLAARADNLSSEIAAAQAAHDQAQKLLDQYEGMIAQLKTERDQLIKTYREQGEAEKARLIEEGEREARRVAQDTQRMLNNELAHMQQKIESELVEVSLERAEVLVKEKLNLTDHNRITDEYLTSLESAQG